MITTDTIATWLRLFTSDVVANVDELTQLDAAIGDADHGSNMERGMTAVVDGLADGPAQPGPLLKKAGMTLVSKVGGASGPLYGTLMLRMAGTIGDATEIDAPMLAAALRAGLAGVVERGHAQSGDKTMFDALNPACDALDAALADGADLAKALRAAADAAAAGRDSTVDMVARKGRASYLGERSVGHQDPGATSAAMLINALARAANEVRQP